MKFHAKTLDDIAAHFEANATECEMRLGNGKEPHPHDAGVGAVTLRRAEVSRLTAEAATWKAAALIMRNTVMG